MPPICFVALTLPQFIQLDMITSSVALEGTEPIMPPMLVFESAVIVPWFSQFVIVPPPVVEATCPQIPPMLSEFAVTSP